MSSLTSWLNENFIGSYSTGPFSSPNGLDDGTVNIYDLTDPNVMDMLNAYVGTVAEREYINPYTPIQQLRMKLNTIGLHFGDVINLPEEGGTIDLPMTQFGGRFGKLRDDSADISSDDGITHRLGNSLNLRLKFEKTSSHRWHIEAEFMGKPKDDMSEAIDINIAKNKDIVDMDNNIKTFCEGKNCDNVSAVAELIKMKQYLQSYLQWSELEESERGIFPESVVNLWEDIFINLDKYIKESPDYSTPKNINAQMFVESNIKIFNHRYGDDARNTLYAIANKLFVG